MMTTYDTLEVCVLLKFPPAEFLTKRLESIAISHLLAARFLNPFLEPERQLATHMLGTYCDEVLVITTSSDG